MEARKSKFSALAPATAHLVIAFIIHEARGMSGSSYSGPDFGFGLCQLILQSLDLAVSLTGKIVELLLRNGPHQKLTLERGGHSRNHVERRTECGARIPFQLTPGRPAAHAPAHTRHSLSKRL